MVISVHVSWTEYELYSNYSPRYYCSQNPTLGRGLHRIFTVDRSMEGTTTPRP